MFTKEERLFIWKKVYEMIDRLEDGEYICVALRNVVFMYLKTHKNIYEFRSDEMVRIYKNDIIKASAISTGADRGVLLCSITDSGFTSIAGVISAVKDKLPGKDHKKMIFEIRNDGRNEYGRYNNCGGKI